MPLNKIALIRYKTIDQCLRNRNRNWTLDDLIDACSEAVNKAEGANKGASKRTVQGDLQLMRDPKMGYRAPITVIAKKYYTYADANYSITHQAISKQDEGMIQEAVDFMKHLQDFDHFKAYDGVVQELESILHKNDKELVVEEKPVQESSSEEKITAQNPSIENQLAFDIFKEEPTQQNIFEQNLVEQKHIETSVAQENPAEEILISEDPIEESPVAEILISEDPIEESPVPGEAILISNDLVEESPVPVEEILISEDLVENNPIPDEESLLQAELLTNPIVKQELQQVGSAIVQEVYTNQEIEELANLVFQQFSDQPLNENGTFFSLHARAGLKQVLYNSNLQNLLNILDQDSQLIAAKYYSKIPTANWYTTLHQNITIPVKEKVATDGFTGWSKKDGIISVMAPVELLRTCFSVYIHLNHSNSTNGALKILPGSHKKILNMQERNLVTENVYTQVAAVKAGGVHIVRPLVLQAFGKTTDTHAVHLLQLDFCSTVLPIGLEWLATKD